MKIHKNMKKSLYLSLFLACSFSLIFAQKNVNSYKYLLVPKQYDFLKSPDQHQLNSLTKFLFEKEGFITLFTDEQYPAELASNSCLGLKVDVDDNSGMFNTKLKINLLDCHNIVVYETKEGRSKLKEYKKAFHEALREAFEEIKDLNYSYDGSLNNEVREVEFKDGEIRVVENEAKLAEELKELLAKSKIKEKEIEPVVTEEVEKAEEKEMKPVVEKEVEAEKVDEKKMKPVVAKEVEKVDEKEMKPIVEKEVKKVKEKKTNKAVKKEKTTLEDRKVTLKKATPEKPQIKTLEGTYIMDNWGTCAVSKKEDMYSVVGGDENFEFATIFKTSKPGIYIIKWAAYKQPQLLEIVDNGNLKVDTENGIKIYKKTS